MGFREGEEKQIWEKELRAKYSIHPAAERFPMMEREEFMALADDIVDNGLNQPIITFRYQIIDGRNRFEACLKMGIDPIFKEFEKGDDQIEAFVISENFQRRHLTSDQKKDLAGRLYNEENKTQDEIAKLLKVDQSTVNRWLKDNMHAHNTKTRVDSSGRTRPTKYNKQPKPESEETPEEKFKRRKEEAQEDLISWRKDFSDLLDGDIVVILRKFYSEICQGKKSK